MQAFIPPRPLLPEEPLESAVYCAECQYLDQPVIGCKSGWCKGHGISDVNTPMKCNYYNPDSKLVSVVVFLKSGLSIYSKAIVQDMANQVDPSLLSSFLQAINAFGEELTKEQVSMIEFQKMKILFGRAQYTNGAMIFKGEVNDAMKSHFSSFLFTLEDAFPSYFQEEFNGRPLPERDVDRIALDVMKNYAQDKLYSFPPNLLEGVMCQNCEKRD